MTATRAMHVIETYRIRVWAPDGELSPDQEDALGADRERFDAALRKLVDETGKRSKLSITINSAGC